MKKHINTYFKGLNRDIAFNKYDNQHYYNAENLRLFYKDSSKTFTLNNIEGNISATNLFDTANYDYYGHCVLRDKLLILAIKRTNSTGNDIICVFNINTTTGELTITDAVPGYSYIYKGDLGFVKNNPPKKIIGRYESPSIQKIYWPLS